MNPNINIEWLPVPGYDGYEISNEGDARSWRARGRGKARARSPHRVTPLFHNGSWWVRLIDDEGKRVAFRIEELVFTVHKKRITL